MSFTEKKSSLDPRCIWMLAGVVNYKLCDGGFLCEQCVFHQAMCKMPAVTISAAEQRAGANKMQEASIRQYFNTLFERCRIRLDCHYHPSGFWCRPDAPGVMLLGIDPLLPRLLYPVERLCLPTVGRRYRRGQLIAWIFRKGKTYPFYSPLDGTVTALHTGGSDLHAPQFQQFEQPFFRIAGEQLLEQLQLRSDDAGGLQYYIEKICRIREKIAGQLREMFASHSTLTLADGGAVERDLEKVFGRKVFEELLEIFSAKNR